MAKEQVEGRIEETIGKVTDAPGKVVGNKALAQAQAQATRNNACWDHAVVAERKRSAKGPGAPTAQEAMALWRLNHKNVSDLFDEYESINITSRKKSLVSRICVDLTIHAQVEEEVLYPALNEILKDKRLAPQAILKHTTLKGLIAEGENADGKDFDSKVKVLSAYVKNHIKERQNQMLPRLIATRLDVIDIGARIASRKEEIVAENARLGVKLNDQNRAPASIQGYR